MRACLSVLAASLLSACTADREPTPPARDIALRRASGDAQETRTAGTTLPAPLVVSAVDRSGRGAPDAMITWTTSDGAVAGDARTDAAGQAHASWRLAPRLGGQSAVAHLGSRDSVIFRARVLASDARLARDTLVLRSGEHARVTWQPLDAAGVALAAGEVDARWASGDAAVATVGADGQVAALRDGVTELTADLSALGLARPLRATIVVGVPLAGRVELLDGTAPHGLRVYVRTASGVDSADVAADGRFALRARSAALRDSTEILVDAADRVARRWFPSLTRWTPGSGDAPPLRFVLLPLRWRFASGAFAGGEIPLSLNAALGAGLAGAPGGAPWYDRNWFLDRVAPLGSAPTLEAFPDDAFPLPVYFDRDRSRMPIVADDSTAFWRALDALGDAVGTRLYRPTEKRLVPEREVATAAGSLVTRAYAVAVVVDSVLLQGLAASTWTTACVGERLAAHPCLGVLDRVDATLSFSGRTRRVREAALVQHEAGHVLGLGHTCYWTSVMYAQLDASSWSSVAPSCARWFQGGAWPSGSIDRADAITARDAAYLALYLRVASVVRRVGPAHALHAAFLGERHLLLGLE
ncbi:hypothetical protein [Gemmatirosa kalamazoonensis]|nr:hypothetical protein [Gemmatirosa kalamazoonensis]